MSEESVINKQHTPDQGMSADAAGTTLFILVVIGVIAAGIWQMWGKKDAGAELTNYQNLATNTIGLMKGVDGYAFTSGARMTGAIIQTGAAKGMTIQGDPASGTATLWNSWGARLWWHRIRPGAPVSITASPSPRTRFPSRPACRLAQG
nr:type 4 pilus major pilin [Salmonella enterica]